MGDRTDTMASTRGPMRNFMPTCTWDIVVDDKPVWHQSVQPHGCFVPLNHYSPPEAGPNSHFARFAYQGKTRNQLCPLCRRRTHHFCGENKTQDLGWLITGLPTRKAIFSNPPCSGAPNSTKMCWGWTHSQLPPIAKV